MGRWWGPGKRSFLYVMGTTPHERLRAVKRVEAEERNERTKPERRRSHRRQLQQHNP